ncbi:uncharacterized protein Dvir_GJ26592 [Drosophila virilis]|uniref:Uncharacterized protein n=1 Tax=Drosophila virilis TaxID=7244 RepID=A0A0Q9W7R3_DROVI|nr:uncharacterized protein Dvir_GJ26592 [Drosophila virilis]
MSPASCMENQCKGNLYKKCPCPGPVQPAAVAVDTLPGTCPAVNIAMPTSAQLPPVMMTRTASVGGGGGGFAGGAANASRRTSLWLETLRQTRKLSYANERPMLQQQQQQLQQSPYLPICPYFLYCPP